MQPAPNNSMTAHMHPTLPTISPKGKITFRIIENSDDEFLFQLFASTQDAEMNALIGWGDGDKDHFLRGQFAAQSRAFALNYIGAVHRIIELDGMPIGRLIINRSDESLRIVDLSLMPLYRGRGIGTDILRSLMNEAHGGDVPVRLAALPNSPAVRLYLRHGFRAVEERGRHVEMEWRSRGSASTALNI